MIDLDRPGARTQILEALVPTVLEAGAAIWRVFQGEFDVIRKADASPVTVADQQAEAIILQALARIAPGVPVVAEEEAAAGRIPEVGDRFFLVDPLDGTADFVRRGEDFTVNIGLIEHGGPTLGLVYAPAKSHFYAGVVEGGAAWQSRPAPLDEALGARAPLQVRHPGTPLVAVGSKSHEVPQTTAYLQAIGVGERVPVGSSLKFCLLAAGLADVYPRPSPTSEWDTAAGHAVLLAAGGRVFDPDGGALQYGKAGFLNPGFVATGTLEVPPIGPYMRA